jgi:hypothetical protein
LKSAAPTRWAAEAHRESHAFAMAMILAALACRGDIEQRGSPLPRSDDLDAGELKCRAAETDATGVGDRTSTTIGAGIPKPPPTHRR